MNTIMAARIARLGQAQGDREWLCMVGTPDNALEHRNQIFSLAYDYQIREVA